MTQSLQAQEVQGRMGQFRNWEALIGEQVILSLNKYKHK